MVPALYREGYTTPQIARRYGITDVAVWLLLKRRGVEIRNRSECRTKYACDHRFFRRIDTEAKAYWLGFFAADGCVSVKATESAAPVVSLTLGYEDRQHVARFREAIGAEHPVRIYLYGRKKHRGARLAFASRQMAEDFRRLGIRPQKRHGLAFPRLSAHLQHHFMRGYFDGDGCIWTHTTAKGYRNYGVSVVGYLAFVQEYQRRLARACGLAINKLGWRFGTPSIAYGGRVQALRIADFLYRDATIYLRRKKDRFDAMRDHSSVTPPTVK